MESRQDCENAERILLSIQKFQLLVCLVSHLTLSSAVHCYKVVIFFAYYVQDIVKGCSILGVSFGAGLVSGLSTHR